MKMSPNTSTIAYMAKASGCRLDTICEIGLLMPRRVSRGHESGPRVDDEVDRLKGVEDAVCRARASRGCRAGESRAAGRGVARDTRCGAGRRAGDSGRRVRAAAAGNVLDVVDDLRGAARGAVARILEGKSEGAVAVGVGVGGQGAVRGHGVVPVAGVCQG